MTPKEKAQELYWKYAEILYLLHDARALKNSYAKKSALIAVDEIIHSRPVITDSQVEYHKYWKQVKQEIELL